MQLRRQSPLRHPNLSCYRTTESLRFIRSYCCSLASFELSAAAVIGTTGHQLQLHHLWMISLACYVVALGLLARMKWLIGALERMLWRRSDCLRLLRFFESQMSAIEREMRTIGLPRLPLTFHGRLP